MLKKIVGLITAGIVAAGGYYWKTHSKDIQEAAQTVVEEGVSAKTGPAAMKAAKGLSKQLADDAKAQALEAAEGAGGALEGAKKKKKGKAEN